MAAFSEISRIPFEGPKSKNPLAFRYYDENEKVAGKTMKDHLRFSVVYWHTFRGTGSDPFGPGTALRPWDDGSNSVENAQKRARVAFEFIEKLGAPFYAFHDRDVAPEGANLAETNRNLDAVVKVLKEEQQRTGIKLLWGTANLFSNPRYMHGAATSPQRRRVRLRRGPGEEGARGRPRAGRRGLHVLGRPRRLPESLEHRHEARAGPPRQVPPHGGRLRARRSASRASSTSSRSPRSRPSTSTTPTRRRASTSCAQYDLLPHFKLNIETNHATLAGHTMQHELEYGRRRRGPRLDRRQHGRHAARAGTPTSSRPTSISPRQCMYSVLKYGGFTTGGVNFDAKVRRESFEPIDLFYAHIGGMDAFARGLKIAAAMRADGKLEELLQRALRQLGPGPRQGDRSPASTTSPRSKKSCSKRATPPRTAAAGRR